MQIHLNSYNGWKIVINKTGSRVTYNGYKIDEKGHAVDEVHEDSMENLTDVITIKNKLECLRFELRAERISYGELLELASLREYILDGDVELLQAAGVPEGAQV